MIEPTEGRYLTGDGLTGAYRVWGSGPPLICVHGVYRNSHDFDYLAAALADRFQVICPDMIGRGGSDWAPDIGRYNFEFYARDVLTLADSLGLDNFHYLGTSMGGMIGMVLTAQAPRRVRRLVLNDAGPYVRLSVLREVGQRSLDAPARFASYAEAEAFFAASTASWGPLTAEQRAHIVRHSVRPAGDGWVFHYDPQLIKGFRWPEGDLDIWPLYRSIPCPILVLRGEHSEVVPPDVAEQLRREPRTQVIDVAGAGHAPSLMAPAQIAAVRAFLES